MALINCLHCGNPISDKAIRCPHCKKYVTFNTDNHKEKDSKVAVQSDVQSPPQQQPTLIPNVSESPKQQDSVEADIYNDEEDSNKRFIVLITVLIIIFFVFLYIVTNSNRFSFSNSSSINNNEQITEQVTEEIANTKTKYVYEFVIGDGSFCDDMPFRLTIDTEEETAQLTVGVFDKFGHLTSEKKTFYGTFGYYGGDVNKPYIKGFTGADDYDIYMNNEKYYWFSYKFIDMNNNYLYMGSDEFEAKNPDYRIEMTLVE